MSPSDTEALRRQIDKLATRLKNVRVDFPQHVDAKRVEGEFMQCADRVRKDLGWMDDRLTEKIIYGSQKK